MMRTIAFVAGGAVFGFGLALGGMTQPEVVLSFLRMEDLGLLLVMGGAVLVTMPVYRICRKTISGTRPEGFTASLNRRTVSGAVLFGLGWGISGICPGAAFASIGTGNAPILVAVAAMFLGAYVQGRFMGSAPSTRG